MRFKDVRQGDAIQSGIGLKMQTFLVISEKKRERENILSVYEYFDCVFDNIDNKFRVEKMYGFIGWGDCRKINMSKKKKEELLSFAVANAL